VRLIILKKGGSSVERERMWEWGENENREALRSLSTLDM